MRGQLRQTYLVVIAFPFHQQKLPPEQAEKIPIPVIQGAERLAELRRKRGRMDIPQIQKANAILTNYETVLDYQLDLAQVKESVIVLDEAQ